MRRSLMTFCFFLLVFFPAALSSQGFPGGRPGGPTPIKEAPAPETGRVLTMGGRLSPRRKIDHRIPVTGVINQILVDVGERVEEGTKLLEISRNIVGENYLPVNLEARIEGVVSSIEVYEQEEVNSGSVAVTIIDDEGSILIAQVSDRDAPELRSLLGARVSGSSSDGKVFGGRLLSLSEEPDYTTGLFEARMLFPRQDGLFLGMVLFVDLSMGGSGAIPVEASALVSEGENTGLWIIGEDNSLEFRIVQAQGKGDVSLISSGLEEGERYIVSPTDGAKEGLSLGDYMKASNTSRSNG